ncbi:MAG: ATP-grasp domain-containing protein [Melioribacteraceae bacterium]|nr:ATP-grasp domain-containing protein [Melioribacteraceae bacterium]
MIANPKILICYNEPIGIYKNYIGKTPLKDEDNIDLSEINISKQIESIKAIVAQKYPDVFQLPISSNIQNAYENLNEIKPDAIINFVESVDGIADYESFVTGLFDILGLSYTGNNSLTLGNCLDKIRTKHILKSFGISTPNYIHLRRNREVDEKQFNLNFPVITKLISEDASIGISEKSVVNNFSELKKQIKFLFRHYKKDVILEEFIVGREINVSIFGNDILPLSEIRFDELPADLPKLVTYEAKWAPNSIYYSSTKPVCPAVITKRVEKRIKDVALSAFRALNCRDYARVDIRLNSNYTPFVIEVNPNPDISPDSGFIRSAKNFGFTYEDVIDRLIEFALKRAVHD